MNTSNVPELQSFLQTHEGHPLDLRERCERLCKMVDLDAPQKVLDFTAGHVIRSIIYAVGASALTEIAAHLISDAKELSGVCPFCPEERPLLADHRMCAECFSLVQADEQEAEKLEQLAATLDASGEADAGEVH